MKEKMLGINSELFSILEESVDGSHIFMVDLINGYSRWSESAVEYFGLPERETHDTYNMWGERIYPEDRSIFYDDFGKILRGEADKHCCEYRVRNSSGEYIWIRCKGSVMHNEDGKAAVFAGAITNLGMIGKYDATTNLKNIYEFRSDLYNWTKNGVGHAGIMMLDIDEFSRVNERHTYSFGNMVLSNFGRQIKESCSEHATIYRMDGDKFVCFYPGGEEEDLRRCFDQFQYIAGNTVRVEGKDLHFTLSAGAVFYPAHGADADTIHRNLEYALQWAKRDKKRELIFFNEQILDASMREIVLAEELSRCVMNDCERFSLCYQPIVDSISGRLLSCEALLRWTNREGKMVSPAEFIPILESSGEICKVGNWIVETALRQLSQWHQILPYLQVNINVSYVQFRHPKFKEFVMEQLRRFEIDPGCLILELTETCRIIDMEELKAEFDFFRKNGVNVALDDFGTGYASVSVLKDLPIDWIKIDHGFVSKLTQSETDQHIIEYLISLCQKLGLSVCVEGIETDDIRSLVETYNPDSMQGYYFSRPVSPGDFYEHFITH